ncbi:MAG: MarR family transcriptional regulator [Desulfobacteraceae bacterium]|jgi:DNA-binding MarR family transcriptional regulator|nr:MAG: MarR family transcriptional regulator [Desulfobacteraceae bacterium]
MSNYENCIIFLLAKAYQNAHGRFKKRLAEYELTPIQHLILEVLREEEGLSAGEIGKRLSLDNATLSGVLDRMAEKNWIVKETDLQDRRFLRLYLSVEARTKLPFLLQAREKANEEIMAGLTLEEKVLLKRLLRDLRA